MISVPIRELKNRLSEYLRLVKAGEEILVTDRGEVVAELLKPRLAHGLEGNPFASMILQGKARWSGRPNNPKLYPKMKRLTSKVTSKELLDQERGDR